MPKSLYVDPVATRAPGKIHFEDIPVCAYNKTIAEERANFSDEDLVRIYRDITILREFENMLNLIKTQASYNGIDTTYPGPAHLSLGQEASCVGEAYLLDKDDYIFGSHRSHSEILAKSLSCIEKMSDDELMKVMENFLGGKTLRAVEKFGKCDNVKELAIRFVLYGTLAEIFAREPGFHHGMGGSMHAFFLPFGVYPNNAIVGGSATISAGAALYKKVNQKKGIVVCNIGDASLGCGPVWEAFNFAAMDQLKTLWEEGMKGGLPVIFNIFNNSYGMGGQTRGETMAYDLLARIGAGITPNQMHAERIDGWNPLAVIDAYKRKLELLKNNDGPVLLDVVTYRLLGHSTSDQNAYRTKEEIEDWRSYDPIIKYRQSLVEAGVAEDSKFEEILKETSERMTMICKAASDKGISPYVDFVKEPDYVANLMFSNETVRSMDPEGKVRVDTPKEENSRWKSVQSKERSAFKNGQPVSKMKVYNIRDAIFEPMFNKYYEDPTLIAYGEDVRDWGGAYAVYRGMMESIPYSRLFNSPISEAAIVGSGVGYAMCGGRAVIELMYCDFIGRAGDEVFNQMSKWQAMSAGILKMPLVLRVSVGAKYGAQHSQDWVAIVSHIPGLKVMFPATPYEAKGIMQAALNGTDPVIIFESQRIYDKGEEFHEGGVPVEEYEWQPGAVNKVRDGKDLTILTIGATLYRALDAAKELSEKYGMEADVINMPSLVPLDYTDIIASVKKTGRVVLASDACARGSFLNDVAQNISNLCFDYLDAPPVVVGAKNWITPPYEFDEFFFPQAEWIVDAVSAKIVPLDGYVSKITPTEAQFLKNAKAGV
ncbi:alpha-ketoacid dehydrogenase subunit alpha/beta [Candidatus Avoscillospira sp. LCP25S3_F1]|uniref:alpha-ketoacid dehydrogenase subunit alpha/beta n=1 Tax=Candidatus Avoscillospira sp. LCP25S3_F1 TaxID=3438825 RepID=UPI003F92A7F5